MLVIYPPPNVVAAAFGRLCVETSINTFAAWMRSAAAFGRLCVETLGITMSQVSTVAAAFGRLCVETNVDKKIVEDILPQPPSGGCVLKLSN